jgi:hypothetical protein
VSEDGLKQKGFSMSKSVENVISLKVAGEHKRDSTSVQRTVDTPAPVGETAGDLSYLKFDLSPLNDDQPMILPAHHANSA